MRKRRPRLLHFITRGIVGGAPLHVFELLRSYQHDFEVALAVGNEGYLSQLVREEGLPVYIIEHLKRPISPFRDWRALKECRAAVRDFKPDLIHAHTSKAGILARLAAYIEGVPAVFTAHGWAFTEGVPSFQRWVGLACESLAARSCDAIITVSHHDREIALRHSIAPPDKLRVVHNGIPVFDRVEGPEIKDLSESPLRLVVASRFDEQKDHPTLLRALARVRFPFVLDLLGDGPLRHVSERLAASLGLSDRVHFRGNQYNVREWFVRSDVVLQPSNWEGLPLTILEAMEASRPVIASEVGGVAEIVFPGETGFLVPRGNSDAWVHALDEIASCARKRKAMGEEARDRLERSFSSSCMVEATAEVYGSILKRYSEEELAKKPDPPRMPNRLSLLGSRDAVNGAPHALSSVSRSKSG